MTATYSEERQDKPAPLHKTRIGDAAGFCSPWNSAECEPLDVDFFEAPVESSPAREFGSAIDSIDWAQNEDRDRTARPIEFAHPGEQAFARMLEARQISWRYKPRTFAVEWDEEGNFVDCFTPDFFLPANKMYVVLVSPDDGASTAKTRKVKMLRRQHPKIRIAVFCPADSRETFKAVS